jgi:hypothetical protein
MPRTSSTKLSSARRSSMSSPTSRIVALGVGRESKGAQLPVGWSFVASAFFSFPSSSRRRPREEDDQEAQGFGGSLGSRH